MPESRAEEGRPPAGSSRALWACQKGLVQLSPLGKQGGSGESLGMLIGKAVSMWESGDPAILPWVAPTALNGSLQPKLLLPSLDRLSLSPLPLSSPPSLLLLPSFCGSGG